MLLESYDLQLFAKDGEGGEKTEEPTTKKLSDARKNGQVAKSTDLTTAFCMLVIFIILKQYLGTLGNDFLEQFHFFYSKISDYTNTNFTLQLACATAGEAIKSILIMALPFLVILFALTVIVFLMQVKWKISFEPMKPKIDKFSPINGIKRLFSVQKLIELLLAIAKITIMVYVVYSYLIDKWTLIRDMYHYTLAQGIELIGDIIVNIGIRISACFLVIGFADYMYQRWKFHNDMKMTKQEVKDEYKNSEGDPKIKSQQRARMRQASQRRMMQELPQADVVITNPTHLAVAIKYDKEKYDAPVVIAKGADYLAQKIKDVARENDIEIVENKPLARMLYHNVDIGNQIPPELYQMVAEVLAYVYGLKGKL